MGRTEFYPCVDNVCKYYEVWKINSYTLVWSIGNKGSLEVTRQMFVCMGCKYFLKRSMKTNR